MLARSLAVESIEADGPRLDLGMSGSRRGLSNLDADALMVLSEKAAPLIKLLDDEEGRPIFLATSIDVVLIAFSEIVDGCDAVRVGLGCSVRIRGRDGEGGIADRFGGLCLNEHF